ncbi:lipase chaperone [Chitinimonas arctica]|uniref:Lipase chaperone n=1 Tax=Chitinimonas arctica TaxID=2594795 RepID=A0A516SEQ7_9NEIS|nr:lipase secretion chaperone [Chitinimonas arctica]QDQ26646.1 lipase chaperone [Chitinimonas arctica]
MSFSVKQRPVLLAAAAGLVLLAVLWRGGPSTRPAREINVPAPSLVGTVADGATRLASEGTVANEALRDLFDYYLATQGEQSLPQIVAQLERELDSRLPAKEAAAAKRLLQRYLAFKRALIAREQDPDLAGTSLAAMRARLDATRRLRGEFFSSGEDKAMFGWQDSYDSDALSRLEINRDQRLSPAQKAASLARLDASLPPDILQARQMPMQHLTLADNVATARQQGADEQKVFQLRAASVGKEAAERLAVLDRDEAAWQQRMAAYLADLALISKNGLPAAEQAQAISQLRASRFTAEEQLRLTAYEPAT